MKNFGEKIARGIETIKKGAKEMRKAFSEKFENAKKELAEKVLGAKSPEDMIALGKKLQEQGEALKAEEVGVKQEEKAETAEEEMIDEEALGAETRESIKTDSNERLAEEQAETERVEAEKATAKAAEEYAQKSKDSDDVKKAEILASLGLEKTETAPAEKTEAVTAEKAEPVKEGPAIDPVEVNNRIINIPEHKRQAAIDNLTQDEIQAVAKNIAKHDDLREMRDFLGVFNNKAEIVMQPEIINKFKELLSSGRTHVYSIEGMFLDNLPCNKEIFDDPAVQKGVQNSIRAFLSYQTGREWPNISATVDNVVKGANIDNQGLRTIAEGIKGNRDISDSFLQHFTVKRIYPEV